MKSNTKSEINFRDRDLVFVDLETTGLFPEIHEIVEIGALLVDSSTFKIKDKYYAKVRPDRLEDASQEALDMNIYREEDWKDSLDIKIALKQFSEFAGSSMPAGWKVDFDYHFLDIQYRKNIVKYNFDYHLLDVCTIAYVHYMNDKKPVNLSLRQVARILDVDLSEQHGAMDDITATYNIFLKLIAEFR